MYLRVSSITPLACIPSYTESSGHHASICEMTARKVHVRCLSARRQLIGSRNLCLEGRRSVPIGCATSPQQLPHYILWTKLLTRISSTLLILVTVVSDWVWMARQHRHQLTQVPSRRLALV